MEWIKTAEGKIDWYVVGFLFMIFGGLMLLFMMDSSCI